MGRVGVITHRERHDGGFNIVHIKDAIDNSFATRETNVFVIGREKPWISLPKGKGVKVRSVSSTFGHHAHADRATFSCLSRRREIAAGLMLLLDTKCIGRQRPICKCERNGEASSTIVSSNEQRNEPNSINLHCTNFVVVMASYAPTISFSRWIRRDLSQICPPSIIPSQLAERS